MELCENNLSLFDPAPVDPCVEKTEWIPFAPVGQIGRNAPLEFDIPGKFGIVRRFKQDQAQSGTTHRQRRR